MSVLVNPPVRIPYRYGLLSITQVVEHGNLFRLTADTDYVFDSVACNEGMIWDPSCEPGFTVTFTRTANANEFQVIFDPSAGPYEASIDGGPFQPFSNGGTFVEVTSPFTAVIRETTGFQREVTITGILPGSPEGTVYSGVSGGFNNTPKEISEGIDHPSGAPFVVVSGVQCTLIATPDIEQQAKDALASKEQNLVEQAMWQKLKTGSPVLPAGAGAVSLVKGVAALEQYLRDQTGFTGVLHSDAYVAPYATQAMAVTNLNTETIKRTGLWTPWVFGGGYDLSGPTGQPAPAADQAWIYATGNVVIHRGDVIVPGGAKGGFDITNNQAFVIAERPYAIIHDCPIAAVLVQLEEAAP